MFFGNTAVEMIKERIMMMTHKRLHLKIIYKMFINIVTHWPIEPKMYQHLNEI